MVDIEEGALVMVDPGCVVDPDCAVVLDSAFDVSLIADVEDGLIVEAELR